jgi:hypothetical protein
MLPERVFDSTDGISIFRRTTSFVIFSSSPALIISRVTFDPAGQRIFFTASESSRPFNSTLFAFVIISPDRISASFAGEPARILSTKTPKSLSKITAPIPSKSPLRASLNFSVSSGVKYSVCLSFKDCVSPLIIPYTRSFSDTD